MKSKCCIRGETCPGPAGAGTFSSNTGSHTCSGCGRAWTGQNPKICFLCPHTGARLSLGALLTAGDKELGYSPLSLSLPPPSLGHTSGPCASVLLGAVKLEVTAGELWVGGMRAGSCGSSPVPEDILAGFLPGPCCPSALLLEE